MTPLGHALAAQADLLELAHGPDRARMQVLDREFADRAIAERRAKFPTVDTWNVLDVLAFQEGRIRELRAANTEYQAALARVRGGRR